MRKAILAAVFGLLLASPALAGPCGSAQPEPQTSSVPPTASPA